MLPWSAFLMLAFAFLFAAGGDFGIWELRQEICVKIRFYKVQVFQNAGFIKCLRIHKYSPIFSSLSLDMVAGHFQMPKSPSLPQPGNKPRLQSVLFCSARFNGEGSMLAVDFRILPSTPVNSSNFFPFLGDRDSRSVNDNNDSKVIFATFLLGCRRRTQS